MKEAAGIIWEEYLVDPLIDYDFRKVRDKIKELNGIVVLYGASLMARYALYALEELGVEVDMICDSNSQKEGDVFCGHKIVLIDDIGGDSRPYFVFLCAIYPKPMLSKLRSLGVENAYSCVPLFESTDFTTASSCQGGLSQENSYQDNCRDINIYNNAFFGFRSELSSDELKLGSIDIQVTEGCSMKCIDCSNLMQYYTSPKEADFDILFESIDKIAAAVDCVYELRVLGGEPFMVKKIFEVIEKLISIPNFRKIIIYTNGTIVPKGRNLECLQHDKVHVDITNYGEHSRNLSRLTQALGDSNIHFSSKVPAWTDSGKILPFRERTEEESNELFDNCCTHDVYTLLHGQLYRCPFSANATNLEAIPDAPEEIVDIIESNEIKNLRQKLTSFQKDIKFLKACAYCNGRDYNVGQIEVAIQTKEPLVIPKLTD